MADGGDRLRTDFSDSAVGRRLALCAELHGLERGTRVLTAKAAAEVRQRAHAILRLLLRGEELGGSRITDALHSRDAASRLFEREIEAARAGNDADQFRAALLLGDLQRMASHAASAGRRPSDAPLAFPAVPGDFIKDDPDSPYRAESVAMPVLTEAKALGALPEGLSSAAAKVIAENNSLAQIKLEDMAQIAPELYADYTAARGAVDAMPVPKRIEHDFEERAAKRGELLERMWSLQEQLQAAAVAEFERRKAAIAATVTDYAAGVMAESEVTEDRATQWASRQVVITKRAANRLKKMGYAPEQVLKDAAEFYRLARGRIEKVVIDSTGDRRANASSIDSHGTAGRINLGSAFDKRVLWHELGHHVEADPVAAAAARLFIRLRSEDGKLYSLKKLTGIKYGPGEKAFKNGFFDPYVGKVYSGGITEVFSMALESFSSPFLLAMRIAVDPQTFEFVVGYLRSPKSALQELHLAMRQTLREGFEAAEEHAEQAAKSSVKREVAKVADFIPATELPDDVGEWAKSVPATHGWKVVGYLSKAHDGLYYVMAEGKARHPDTGRRGRMFVFFKVNPDATGVPMARTAVPLSEPEIARLFLWGWRQTGIEPSYRSLASGALTVSEE